MRTQLRPRLRPLLLASALAAVVPLAPAIAQTTAPAPAAASAPAAQRLTIREIYDRVEAAGYRNQREIEFERGRYVVKATNAQGQSVKLEVNAGSGAIERERVRR